MVVEQLLSCETDDYRTAVLGCVNALVHGAPGLSQRCDIRDQLLGQQCVIFIGSLLVRY